MHIKILVIPDKVKQVKVRDVVVRGKPLVGRHRDLQRGRSFSRVGLGTQQLARRSGLGVQEKSSCLEIENYLKHGKSNVQCHSDQIT